MTILNSVLICDKHTHEHTEQTNNKRELNLIKGIYKIPKTDVILNGELLNTFP